jgi:hypothetical protein
MMQNLPRVKQRPHRRHKCHSTRRSYQASGFFLGNARRKSSFASDARRNSSGEHLGFSPVCPARRASTRRPTCQIPPKAFPLAGGETDIGSTLSHIGRNRGLSSGNFELVILPHVCWKDVGSRVRPQHRQHPRRVSRGPRCAPARHRSAAANVLRHRSHRVLLASGRHQEILRGALAVVAEC